jgi:hypothetical protein
MTKRPSPHADLGTSQWKKQRLLVLKRDGYVCAYCGAEANQVDHVIPRARGGTHDMDNLVACCASCNNAKGSKAVFLAGASTPPVLLTVSLRDATQSDVVSGNFAQKP